MKLGNYNNGIKIQMGCKMGCSAVECSLQNIEAMMRCGKVEEVKKQSDTNSKIEEFQKRNLEEINVTDVYEELLG